MEIAGALSLLCFVASILLIAFVFLAFAIRIVKEDTRLSVYRLGRYLGDKGPGVVLVIPIIDRVVPKELGALEKISGRSFSGYVGEALTTVFTDGKISLSGEEWDATSQHLISAGERVRVVRLILEVEKEIAVTGKDE